MPCPQHAHRLTARSRPARLLSAPTTSITVGVVRCSIRPSTCSPAGSSRVGAVGGERQISRTSSSTCAAPGASVGPSRRERESKCEGVANGSSSTEKARQPCGRSSTTSEPSATPVLLPSVKVAAVSYDCPGTPAATSPCRRYAMPAPAVHARAREHTKPAVRGVTHGSTHGQGGGNTEGVGPSQSHLRNLGAELVELELLGPTDRIHRVCFRSARQPEQPSMRCRAEGSPLLCAHAPRRRQQNTPRGFGRCAPV